MEILDYNYYVHTYCFYNTLVFPLDGRLESKGRVSLEFLPSEAEQPVVVGPNPDVRTVVAGVAGQQEQGGLVTLQHTNRWTGHSTTHKQVDWSLQHTNRWTGHSTTHKQVDWSLYNTEQVDWSLYNTQPGGLVTLQHTQVDWSLYNTQTGGLVTLQHTNRWTGHSTTHKQVDWSLYNTQTGGLVTLQHTNRWTGHSTTHKQVDWSLYNTQTGGLVTLQHTNRWTGHSTIHKQVDWSLYNTQTGGLVTLQYTTSHSTQTAGQQEQGGLVTLQYTNRWTGHSTTHNIIQYTNSRPAGTGWTGHSTIHNTHSTQTGGLVTLQHTTHVLFNDALNTFYLRLHGVRHMVKYHSDSERGNPLPPQGFFYMHHPTDRITHTTAFVTPVVEHWLEREIAQWVHPMKDRSDDPSHHERTLYLGATSRSS